MHEMFPDFIRLDCMYNAHGTEVHKKEVNTDNKNHNVYYFGNHIYTPSGNKTCTFRGLRAQVFLEKYWRLAEPDRLRFQYMIVKCNRVDFKYSIKKSAHRFDFKIFANDFLVLTHLSQAARPCFLQLVCGLEKYTIAPPERADLPNLYAEDERKAASTLYVNKKTQSKRFVIYEKLRADGCLYWDFECRLIGHTSGPAVIHGQTLLERTSYDAFYASHSVMIFNWWQEHKYLKHTRLVKMLSQAVSTYATSANYGLNVVPAIKLETIKSVPSSTHAPTHARSTNEYFKLFVALFMELLATQKAAAYEPNAWVPIQADYVRITIVVDDLLTRLGNKCTQKNRVAVCDRIRKLCRSVQYSKRTQQRHNIGHIFPGVSINLNSKELVLDMNMIPFKANDFQCVQAKFWSETKLDNTSARMFMIFGNELSGDYDDDMFGVIDTNQAFASMSPRHKKSSFRVLRMYARALGMELSSSDLRKNASVSFTPVFLQTFLDPSQNKKIKRKDV